MKQTILKLETLKLAVKKLGYSIIFENQKAVMKWDNGEEMTTTLNAYQDIAFSEDIFLNINNVKTLQFDTREEFDKFILERFKLCANDKEMYMEFTGMDEDTYTEWNK